MRISCAVFYHSKYIIINYQMIDTPRQVFSYVIVRARFASEICQDLAQIICATFVFGSFSQNALNWNNIIIGSISTLLLWGIGIISYKI